MVFEFSAEALVALIVAIVGGAVWICSKLEAIHKDLKNFVTNELCRERRENCPCVIARDEEVRCNGR